MRMEIQSGTTLNWALNRNKINKVIELMWNDPYNSSSANGSYFCMTLCVAIATVAAQERKNWFIQEAYWPYISWGTAGASAVCIHSRILFPIVNVCYKNSLLLIQSINLVLLQSSVYTMCSMSVQCLLVSFHLNPVIWNRSVYRSPKVLLQNDILNFH